MSALSSNAVSAHKSISINSPSSADFGPRRRLAASRTPAKRFLFCRCKLGGFKGRGVVVAAASAEDGVAVNGTRTQGNEVVEEMRVKLDERLESGDASGGLVQAIHDAARAVELAIVERGSMSRGSWFAKNWLGVDKNAWIKTLSYQAAVYSLLQAAIEISSRGEARDRDTNVSVERSLLRLCSPLESVIRDQLSSKNPAINEWFWSHQQPKIMSTFMVLFERDHRFNAATSLCWKGEPSDSGTTSDVSLLMLSLSCLAAITKLGSAKVSCSQFFSMVPEITGRLMDMLLDYIPIKEVYKCVEDIGLRREFLMHFGPRASANSLGNNYGGDEIEFWVALIQKQLQRAIDREKIWSRLTTCESIEVLEKDLAIFGFFIALGRSSQSFLSSNGLNVLNEPLEGFIRYLIGGSVLFYPQLSSISSYQLYVEVVCEELDWLPFYPSDISGVVENNMVNEEEMREGEIISVVANVCSYWMTSFIKYSTWLQNPSNIKAARFLSRGHSMLMERMEELGLLKEKRKKRVKQVSPNNTTVQTGMQSFDEALESVEGALNRLESLLQELHISNANNGKQQLQAACSDLERIRKLKKEAEFLEASFRAKAASLREVGIDSDQGKANEVRKVSDEDIVGSQVDKQPRGFWSFLVQNSTRRSELGSSTADQNVSTEKSDNQVTVTNDISRFELLRNELIELEKRVQRSTDDSQIEEENDDIEDISNQAPSGKPLRLVQEPKKDNILAKSMEKIKETTTDVLQGTKLLATDVSAAMVLLKRSVSGDELTEKEKKALRRTLTDLASVIPIGFLMLLPVTAVGHAAILAFIQRYVPALIPSTYAPERLDLLRQLEKVKQMEELQDSDVTEAVGPQ